MDSKALKPCPCCQQDAYVEKRKGRQSVTARKWYRERVYCRNKKCGLTTATFRQPGQAITAWNTRADDDRIEALQADKAMQQHELYSKYELADSLRIILTKRGLKIVETGQ